MKNKNKIINLIQKIRAKNNKNWMDIMRLAFKYAPKDSAKIMKKMSKGQKKVGKVMREFKKGKLHSGKSGKIVKNPKQAIAIALSEAKMSKKRKK